MSEAESPPIAAPAKKRPRRLGLIIPFALLLVLALGWWGYWSFLKAEATRRIEAAFAAERADGATAQVRIVRAWGFPRELAFELEGLAYSPADGAWRADVQSLRLNVNPVNPQHIIFDAIAPIRLRFDEGETATLSSPDLRISLRMNGEALAQAGFEGAQINYADDNPEGRSFR
ncbi:MAG: DUF2125 domain-containing protein, partial [Hyphomonadaceae bacterium]